MALALVAFAGWLVWPPQCRPVLRAVVFAARAPLTVDHINRLGLVRCEAEFKAGMALNSSLRVKPLRAGHGDLLLAGGLVLLAGAMTGRAASFAALPAFVLLIAACADPAARWAGRTFGNFVGHLPGQISLFVYLIQGLFLQDAVAAAAGSLASASFVAALVAGGRFVFPPHGCCGSRSRCRGRP